MIYICHIPCQKKKLLQNLNPKINKIIISVVVKLICRGWWSRGGDDDVNICYMHFDH